jgi:hypothetical protein
MNALNNKLNKEWEKWIESCGTASGFNTFIERKYGFTYSVEKVENGTIVAFVDKVVDEEKYMWFNLLC